MKAYWTSAVVVAGLIVSLTAGSQEIAPPGSAEAGPQARRAGEPPAAMTNASVIEMVGLGLDETIIITKIQQSPVTFDTSTKGLVELKNANVPAAVVKAMILRPQGSAPMVARADTGQVQAFSAKPKSFGEVERILIKAPTEVIRANSEEILKGKGGPTVNPSDSGYDAVLIIGVDCGDQTISLWTGANYCTCEGSMTLEIAGNRVWSTTDSERAANSAKAGKKMVERMSEEFVGAWRSAQGR